jgi:glucose-6-phosphate 1-dehydrogenase
MANSGAPRPDNHVIVLFGATGDLAKRKLLPGLFHLHAAGLLPKEYRIIGCAPPSFALTTEQFRGHAEGACDDFSITKPTDPSWPSFAERLSFAAAEPGNTSGLVDAIQQAEKEIGGAPRRLYHLAIPPAAFTAVVGMLGEARLNGGETRVIIEKPFGTDLASARALNQAVHAVFDESQIFRIDHFLGNAEMAFYYKDSYAASHALEGYEHLILMAMIGDQSLFTRSDGIERLWEISRPLLENPPPVDPYPVGSFGPESVQRQITPYHWHLPHV